MTVPITQRTPTTAGELAHWDIVSVPASAMLTEAAKTMANFKISGLAVKDHEGKVVGVVSQSDVGKAVAQNDASAWAYGDYYCEFWVEHPEREIALPVKVTDRLVSEVMSRTIFQVKASDSIEHVISTMQGAHIHRLLVMGDDGRVGIISNSDLVALIPSLLAHAVA